MTLYISVFLIIFFGGEGGQTNILRNRGGRTCRLKLKCLILAKAQGGGGMPPLKPPKQPVHGKGIYICTCTCTCMLYLHCIHMKRYYYMYIHCTSINVHRTLYGYMYTYMYMYNIIHVPNEQTRKHKTIQQHPRQLFSQRKMIFLRWDYACTCTCTCTCIYTYCIIIHSLRTCMYK